MLLVLVAYSEICLVLAMCFWFIKRASKHDQESLGAFRRYEGRGRRKERRIEYLVRVRIEIQHNDSGWVTNIVD